MSRSPKASCGICVTGCRRCAREADSSPGSRGPSSRDGASRHSVAEARVRYLAKEVANYASSRFTDEPDLWRVHVRAIRAILSAIESTTREGDRAAQVVKKAEFFFLVGLSSVGTAFAILIVEVTL
jgi:hypothetical protein